MVDVREGIINQKKKFGQERRELQELQAFVAKHLQPAKPGGVLIEQNIRKNQLKEQQNRKKELESKLALLNENIELLKKDTPKRTEDAHGPSGGAEEAISPMQRKEDMEKKLVEAQGLVEKLKNE